MRDKHLDALEASATKMKRQMDEVLAAAWAIINAAEDGTFDSVDMYGKCITLRCQPDVGRFIQLFTGTVSVDGSHREEMLVRTGRQSTCLLNSPKGRIAVQEVIGRWLSRQT